MWYVNSFIQELSYSGQKGMKKRKKKQWRKSGFKLTIYIKKGINSNCFNKLYCSDKTRFCDGEIN